jgi:hypothetical protein
MKISTVIAALAVSLATAAPAVEKRTSGGGVVTVPFTKVAISPKSKSNDGLSKREVIPTTIENAKDVLAYLVDVNFGTPSQTFKALIDTGSSDLWIYEQSSQGPGFNAADSSTFNGTLNMMKYETRLAAY